MSSLTLDQAVPYALQRLQAGAGQEAVNILQQVLAQQPNHVEALHLLADIARQSGQLQVAFDFIQRAIAQSPGDARFFHVLSLIFDAAQRWPEAAEAARRATQLNPTFAEAHNNLGNFLRLQGRPAEAIASFRAALNLQPLNAEMHNNLAIALQACGAAQEAVAEFRRALELQPAFFGAYCNLGLTLSHLGRPTEAVAAFEAAVRLQPNHPQALEYLATQLTDLRRYADAIAVLRQLVAISPNHPVALNDLGLCLTESRQPVEAEAVLRECLRVDPNFVPAHINLGRAFEQRNLIEPAIACYRRALELQPDHVSAMNNLASALKEHGDVPGAVELLRRVVQIDPTRAGIHSNLIYLLHFHPGVDAVAIGADAAQWERQHAAPLRPPVRPPARDSSPERRLRIGYVSPDFWEQAECYFVLPLLENHDREQFEVYCYASVSKSDAVTARYRQLADVWRDVRSLSDEALAQTIAADGIDVLVDLTMHMADNRLLTFARQPAPVQISWLAYPGSTGLSEIDYRITDSWMEPENLATCCSSETPLRLPDSWCAYMPLAPFPEVAPLPALASGRVTFGSLNSFRKMNPGVIARWARVLGAVPDSRLMVLIPPGLAERQLQDSFASHGIAPERVICVPPVRRENYLAYYGQIDLALDPFPYNGITTTCDALWMGVPVLTLPGPLAASRAGLSLLQSAGFPEWVAESEEDYLRLATTMAADLPRLAETRRGLRARIAASPLMNGKRFARHFEEACRSGWRRLCAENRPAI